MNRFGPKSMKKSYVYLSSPEICEWKKMQICIDRRTTNRKKKLWLWWWRVYIDWHIYIHTVFVHKLLEFRFEFLFCFDCDGVGVWIGRMTSHHTHHSVCTTWKERGWNVSTRCWFWGDLVEGEWGINKKCPIRETSREAKRTGHEEGASEGESVNGGGAFGGEDGVEEWNREEIRRELFLRSDCAVVMRWLYPEWCKGCDWLTIECIHLYLTLWAEHVVLEWRESFRYAILRDCVIEWTGCKSDGRRRGYGESTWVSVIECT